MRAHAPPQNNGESNSKGEKSSILRDLAILETLYSTGLRVSELASLNRNQVDLVRREFMVRGKGKKPRIVFLSDRAVKHIQNYLKSRNDAFEPLFINVGRPRAATDITKGESRRLSTVSIESLVRKYAMLSGITKKSRLTHSAILSPPIFSKTAQTSALYRKCSTTHQSQQPKFTHI